MSRAVEVVVSERQRGLPEKLVRNRADTSYRLIERCRIVLMSADGVAIDYFNAVLAKPFQWTYAGKPLRDA